MLPFVPRQTDPDTTARLARELGVHPVTAQILVGRGLADTEAARRFLNPDASMLHDPLCFRDMERALEEIEDAVDKGTKIVVYGDYDVDGVCATAVLVRSLALLGADVAPFIPHRVREGYGLSGPALARLREQGCEFVITVDNGTTRADEVDKAVSNGMRLVITDHHEPGGRLPDCAVINPKRADTTYPFAGLAGCGVALKLALGLTRRKGVLDQLPFKALWRDLLGLVALGTVADVVPLRDENRALVSLGLRALAATRHEGLKALLDVAGCRGRPLRCSDVGFRLGPRINAAGRLGSAQLALDLMLCDEANEAARLARELDDANTKRQQVERKQSEQALARAKEICAAENPPALVLADESWHPGLVGIVAMRVAETCNKPTICLAVDGDTARGSARSVGGIRLHEALQQAGEHLLTHGGHAFAAGCTLKSSELDKFRESFLGAVASQPREPEGPQEVDAELPIDAVTAPLRAEIERLRPFGSANPEPVFCTYGVRAAGKPRRMGRSERHLSFFAAGERTSIRAVAFNQGEDVTLLSDPVDILYVLRPSNSTDGVELHVRKIVAAG